PIRRRPSWIVAPRIAKGDSTSDFGFPRGTGGSAGASDVSGRGGAAGVDWRAGAGDSLAAATLGWFAAGSRADDCAVERVAPSGRERKTARAAGSFRASIARRNTSWGTEGGLPERISSR